MKETIFHPEARVEMNESFDFYEARLDGLGIRFLLAVEQTVERISTHPDAGVLVAGEFRKRIVPGFPYSIIYRVWGDYIYLVGDRQNNRPTKPSILCADCGPYCSGRTRRPRTPPKGIRGALRSSWIEARSRDRNRVLFLHNGGCRLKTKRGHSEFLGLTLCFRPTRNSRG